MLFFPRLKLAIALLLLTFVASANRIVVFGTVNFPGGAAAINYPLTIQPDSTLCLVKKSIVTNQSGAFETVIECDKNVLKAIISYIDCEGRLVQLVKEEPATLKVEYNIILCAPLNCQAAFNYVISTSNPLKLEFSSNNSHASGPATDEIITRNWSWGDGTPIENANLANITHLFTKPGNYEVCLKIVTRNGCHSYLCKTITIPGSELHCEAAFRFEKVIGETSNPPKTFIKFFSGNSSGINKDEKIIGRRWTFGDGTSLVTNDSNIVHPYLHGGTYNVCLFIKTDKGCYDSICKDLVVPDPVSPQHCEAAFRFEKVIGETSNPPKTFIKFFSGNSSGINKDDKIIGRRWTFGDGTSLVTNDSNIVHPYLHGGTYNVCLFIKTNKGCYDSICKDLVVPDPVSPQHCEAAFRFEKVIGETSNPPKTFIRFFSGNSSGINKDDKIIGRRWTFGDGTSLVSNDSNIVHPYLHGGTYNVCLFIKTDKGCYDSICKDLVVPDPVSTLRCEAGFSSVVNGFTILLNSNKSVIVAGDSIIKRIWSFGDGKYGEGDLKEPHHTYLHSGQYEVCLKIITRMGCEERVCRLINVSDGTKKCQASFVTENIGNEKLRFSSSSSYALNPGDSIIKRHWNFGDGNNLYGNNLAPIHAYTKSGTYTACLVIVTKSGCESRICKQDVVNGPIVSGSLDITLVTCFPNPVKNILYATILSNHENIEALIAIYDVYGIVKWSKQVVLPGGSSTWPLPANMLLAGPYIIKLTTRFGIQHLNFLKN